MLNTLCYTNPFELIKYKSIVYLLFLNYLFYIVAKHGKSSKVIMDRIVEYIVKKGNLVFNF